MAKEKRLASVGSIVLVSQDPAHETSWLPAIVEKAGQNNQIVCSAFSHGNVIHYEGCRHVSDPWWQQDGTLAIAITENIGAWKLRPEDQDIAESIEFVLSSSIGRKAAQKPRPSMTV